MAGDSIEQGAKADAGKPDMTLVPRQVIYEIEKVRRHGTEKYQGRDNWRYVGGERYWRALIRHVLAAWYDYEAVDPESGLHHLSHIATNAAFLLEFMKEDKDAVKSGSSACGGDSQYDDLHG